MKHQESGEIEQEAVRGIEIHGADVLNHFQTLICEALQSGDEVEAIRLDHVLAKVEEIIPRLLQAAASQASSILLQCENINRLHYRSDAAGCLSQT